MIRATRIIAWHKLLHIPCESYLNMFCYSNDVHLKLSKNFDEARPKFYNTTSIQTFLRSIDHFSKFATQKSGWMTKLLFSVFTLYICSRISQYRMTLPSIISSQKTLLIINNHSSRFNTFGFASSLFSFIATIWCGCIRKFKVSYQ